MPPIAMLFSRHVVIDRYPFAFTGAHGHPNKPPVAPNLNEEHEWFARLCGAQPC
jgi:hypothetical protein